MISARFVMVHKREASGAVLFVDFDGEIKAVCSALWQAGGKIFLCGVLTNGKIACIL